MLARCAACHFGDCAVANESNDTVQGRHFLFGLLVVLSMALPWNGLTEFVPTPIGMAVSSGKPQYTALTRLQVASPAFIELLIPITWRATDENASEEVH